jgi:predicted nucleic acid-binding protein
MEGQVSDLFNDHLRWSDMVEIMGKKGLRGPDAMIVNLFDKSKFELLITSDSDFENCFTDSFQQASYKSILILQ